MQTKESAVTGPAQRILSCVRKAVVGKDPVLLWVLAAILAGGHILLEDIPGVGKTTMALAFSKVLGLTCNRVQFTPDVLPSDITGYCVPDPVTGTMQYCPGSLLCNLFLADELNRASTRTQAALLEAMEEGQVTVDGITHSLPRPFVVIATQNPTGAAGTALLPDSQMDRFMVRLSLGYPTARDEMAMILQRQQNNPLAQLQPVLSQDDLAGLQALVEDTYLSDPVVQYIVGLMVATRHNDQILRGASPRATLAVTNLSKAVARLRGRDYVVPGDVREVFLHALSHRILMAPRAQSKSAEQILREILEATAAPKLC